MNTITSQSQRESETEAALNACVGATCPLQANRYIFMHDWRTGNTWTWHSENITHTHWHSRMH